METVSKWNDVIFGSLSAMGQKIMTELPTVLGAIFLVLLGWLLARIVAYAIRKLLKVVKFDGLMERMKIDESFKKANIDFSASDIVAKFGYWVIILLFFVTAADTLGWTGVSQAVNELLAYIPKLFSAIMIFVLGYYIANIVRTALNGFFLSIGVPTGAALSTFAFYVMLVIITLTSLNQAGVNTTVVTSNLLIILGGIVVAFAISFGLGAKDVLSNILAAYYLKGSIRKGQKIQIGNVEGVVEKIEKTSLTVKSGSGFVIIPTKKLLEENFIIQA